MKSMKERTKWMFANALLDIVMKKDLERSFEQYDNYFSKAQNRLLLELIQEKHFFYRKAFEDTNQNSLFSYMRAANCRITESILKHHLQIDELSKEQLFSINYHSYAWVCCLSEWLRNRCEPELDVYEDYLYDNSIVIYERHPFQEKI